MVSSRTLRIFVSARLGGKDGWKREVVVCLVSGGRAQVNLRMLSVTATMGTYQEGVGKVNIS